MIDRPRNPTRRLARSAELAILAGICLLSIRHWLGELNLSPDSTTYITAAGNLIRTGRLFYFANAASWSMEPEVEPYTEQPPGFVFYLAPFVAAVGEPIDAALIAQGVAIVAFYAALYLILTRLRLVPLLRIATMGIFAFLAPFVQVRSFLWSETLFVAFCLAIGWVAIKLVLDDGRPSDWLLLLGLLAAGSSIRLVGVANLFWIAPILLRRRHLLAGIRLLANRFVYSALALGGLATTLVFLFADALGIGTRGGLGPTQILGIAFGLGALLLGGGAFVLVRISRVRPWSAAQDAGPGGRDLWPAAAVAASILPVLLWFLRNEVLFGAASLTNRAFEAFHPDHLGAPFSYFWDETLNVRFLPQAVVALCVLAFLGAPFFVGSRQRRTAHLCLIAAGLGQLAAVWIPSLASEISGLGDRLLSPTIALAALASLHGLQTAADSLAPRRWAAVLLLLPFAFLALGRDIVPRELLSYPGRINYPIERSLWRELHELDALRSSTHFYSDRDFVHQVFAGIPQRIVWDTRILRDPAAVDTLLASGEGPFILLREGSWEAGAVEELMASGQVPLEKIAFQRYGFVLYYPPE